MEYGTMNVNENYSAIIEPNLYFDAVFQPGITFTDEHQGDANSGLVRVYRVLGDGVGDPGTPAGDFKHENAHNELIDLRLNNAQRRSKKIYKIQANAVPYAAADTHLSLATQECKEGWQASGVACLVHEGTILEDTDKITVANIKSKVIAARKVARKGKAVCNVVLASVDTYSTMLEAAGDQFTPSTNDNMVSTGQVGRWMGMLWVECNQTELTAAKYYDYAGNLQTEDLSDVDFIMYDYRAFSIVDNLDESRIIDSEDFVGSLAQVEINSGYRVTTQARVVVKKNSVVPDASEETDELTVTSVAGTTSGTTAVTVTPALTDGNSYKYKAAASPTMPAVGDTCSAGYTNWDGTADITAESGKTIVIVEVDSSNVCVNFGSATVVSAE